MDLPASQASHRAESAADRVATAGKQPRFDAFWLHERSKLRPAARWSDRDHADDPRRRACDGAASVKAGPAETGPRARAACSLCGRRFCFQGSRGRSLPARLFGGDPDPASSRGGLRCPCPRPSGVGSERGARGERVAAEFRLHADMARAMARAGGNDCLRFRGLWWDLPVSDGRPDATTRWAIIAVTAALAAILVLRLRDPTPPSRTSPGFHLGVRR